MVGRIMRDKEQSKHLTRDQCFWPVMTMPARNGHVGSMAEALEKVRELASDSWGHEPNGWPIGG